MNPSPRTVSCDDYEAAALSRRAVLKASLGLGAGLSLTQMLGDSMMQASFAGSRGGNTLVVLSLRGGIDGLGAVVPHADPGYYQARPTIAVPAERLVCKDAMFGLHPKLAPLAPMWAAGELAAVHAVGLAVPNRSHFAAIEEVEDADPGSATRSGWINRMIGTAKSSGDSGFLDAVAVGSAFPPRSMNGGAAVLAARDLSGLKVPGLDRGYVDDRYAGLERLWGDSAGPLRRAAGEAVTISKTSGETSSASSGAVYPDWAAEYASPLRSAAGLIRADVGTDVIAIDAGSWDHHSGYGTVSSGSMQLNLDGLASSLKAFFDDLGSSRSRVTVITISEFGRRLTENGSQGLDHGWGNMMLIAGAGVRGGRYYGNWPQLDPVAGELQVTTDYRSVLWEIISKRFPDRSLPAMFPGFTNPQTLGLMA